MLKILSICTALSIPFRVGRDGAIRWRCTMGWRGKIGCRCLQRRISKKYAAASNLGAAALPLASRSVSQTFPMLARQGWPMSPRLEQHAARTSRKHQCGTKSRIQKVTCIKDVLANLGDDCKAAITAVVTSKK